MAVQVVLLRAIGPVTHRVMSMERWREAARAAGYGDPQTYIATGNMLLDSDEPPGAVQERMDGIVRSLGLAASNAAVVRTAAQLRALVAASPFPQAAAARPGQVAVYFFAASRPDLGWVASYEGRERLAVVDHHLIVDFDGRVSEGARLLGLVERRSGVATARNWNTLAALASRATEREGRR